MSYGTIYSPGTSLDSPIMLHGSMRRTVPLERSGAHYVLTARCRVKRSAYTRPAFNTLMSAQFSGVGAEHSAHYWVDDVDFEQFGEVLEFTRKWINVPATWSDAATVAFQFPAIVGEREQWTVATPCKVEYAYYRLDGTTYVNPEDVPVVPQFAPYLTSFGTWAVVPYVDTTTTPTLAGYKTSIGTSTDFLAVEPSEVTLYAGNIYQRKTMYSRYR